MKRLVSKLQDASGRKIAIKATLAIAVCAFCAACGGGSAASSSGSGITNEVKTAQAKAKKWRPDAVLLEIDAQLLPPGPTAGPPAYSYSYTFYSPSDGSGLSVDLSNPAADQFSLGYVDFAKRKPIPDDFLGLEVAIKRAQEQGMEGNKAERASLEVFEPDDHGKDGLMWMIWPINAMRTYMIFASPGEQWQNSFAVFATEIKKLYDKKASADEYTKAFDGKQIVWRGQVKSVEPGSGGSVVTIQTDPAGWELPDGSEIGGFEVKVPMKSNPPAVGDVIRFKATLKGSGATPCVQIKPSTRAQELGINKPLQEIIVNLIDGEVQTKL